MRAAIAATGFFAALGAGGAIAETLAPETCTTLVSEQSLLEAGGAAENLARGPAWAKEHLTQEQIAYVKRLISVREDIAFRCRSFTVVRDPPPPSVAPETAPSPGRKPEALAKTIAAKPASDGMPLPMRRPREAAGEASKQAAGPPPPQSRPDKGGASKSASGPKDAGQASDKPPVKRKTVKAPSGAAKVNDAYVPPPGTTSTFPRPTLN